MNIERIAKLRKLSKKVQPVYMATWDETEKLIGYITALPELLDEIELLQKAINSIMEALPDKLYDELHDRGLFDFTGREE